MADQSKQHLECDKWSADHLDSELFQDSVSIPIFEKSYTLGISSEDAISLSESVFDVRTLLSPRFEMTKAEIQVANLMCRGYSNREIANIRCVSCDTIKCQVSQILSKTNCRNRAEILLLTAILTAHALTQSKPLP